MFLDDENLPLLPEWEEQIQQLEQIRASDLPAGPSFTTEPR
jgi:hypothetical protein